MKFKAKLIRTKDFYKTAYGKISIVLFLVSSIVLFLLPTELFDRNYINEWFGEYSKPFLILNYIFYINGLFVLISRMRYQTIGNLTISDKGIQIIEFSEEMILNIPDIDTIILKYYGHKKKWNAWLPGEINCIEVYDKQNGNYAFKFMLNSQLHKLDLIDSLLGLHDQGVQIKIDYKRNLGSYYSDKDFKELRQMK